MDDWNFVSYSVNHYQILLSFPTPQPYRKTMFRILFPIIFLLTGLMRPLPLAAQSSSLQTARVMPAHRTVTLTGFTRAKRTMIVTPEVSARCVTTTADIGDPVPENTILAGMDTTFIDLDLRRTDVGIRQLRSRIAYLQKETGRSRELVRRDTQARSELDRLEQDLDQAGLNMAELELSRATLVEQKSRHTLHGPAGWTVISRTMEPGEWLAAGTPVAELGDFRTLRIPLALSPEELAGLKSADTLRVTLPDHRLSLPASVFRTSPEFDPGTRKINLELLVTPPQELRRGGLRCELSLTVPEPDNTWLIPQNVLFERYETHWVALADGTEIRVILLGRTDDGFVRISSETLQQDDLLRVQP